MCGLRDACDEDEWYWAQVGGRRRRCLSLFARDIEKHVLSGDSVLDTWAWLHRDYIVAQHIISALEKWRQRRGGANTFHFSYDQGLFEWIRDDTKGFSASRFPQSYSMLADLGLFELEPKDETRVGLTELGQRILQCALEASNG
jgi:hypothetical protein